MLITYVWRTLDRLMCCQLYIWEGRLLANIYRVYIFKLWWFVNLGTFLWEWQFDRPFRTKETLNLVNKWFWRQVKRNGTESIGDFWINQYWAQRINLKLHFSWPDFPQPCKIFSFITNKTENYSVSKQQKKLQKIIKSYKSYLKLSRAT